MRLRPRYAAMAAGTAAAVGAVVLATTLTSTTPTPSSSVLAITPYPGCPTGARLVHPTDNLSTLTGVLCLADGTYKGTVTPKASTQFWAQHLRLAVFDSSYATTYAFTGSASSVQLHGLKITRYKPSRQHGAIDSSGASWTVQHCEISYNGDWFTDHTKLGGAGIDWHSGNHWLVDQNYIHHNGEEGYAGGSNGTAVTFTDNEVAWNNVSHQGWGFEAGGGKFWSVGPGTVIKGNNAHDNDGPGLWIDSSSSYAANGYLIDSNTTSNNNAAGIDVEVSHGGTVSNNTSTHDGAFHSDSPSWGAGGISIEQSSGVTVTNNTVHGGAGAFLIDEHRSGYPCPCNNTFSNNAIYHETGWTNSFVASPANFPSLVGNFSTNTSNVWSGNHYYNFGTNSWFVWLGSKLSWSSWQSKGLDKTGTKT